MKRLPLALWSAVVFMFVVLAGCQNTTTTSVKEVMDRTITSLYKTHSQQQLADLNYDQVFALFSEEYLEALSTRHWSFDVNVPVVVSIFRSVEQKQIPFWLNQKGFSKTEFTVKNEQTTYEVWQKKFDTGTVGLGINGFENYSLHYFVSVAPQNNGDQLQLSNFFPANQFVGVLDNGAFTYHDWDELVLSDVPDQLKGQKLLTTIRGRGTETHLIGGFRTTSHPSSAKPDQLLLTWSSDPSSGIDIQWRTDTTVAVGSVAYREKGTSGETAVNAEKYRMEDRALMNDRYCHRFTAQLRGLKPGTTYEYRIGDESWPETQNFTTSSTDDQFSFVWFGDTHYSSKFGEILQKVRAAHSDVAFYSIAGDLVSDGLHRNQWDDLFDYTSQAVCRKPLMSVIGNHDNRAGLGALMYRQMFSYPKNGPEGIEPEHTYSFQYKNALFLMIDATSPIDAQTAWIEKQLAGTKATWKFVMFHFSPYNWEEPYLNIQKAWVPVFDRYHVDMVMGGHVHYYMRSKPLKNGIVVPSYNNGTAYVISIAIPSRNNQATDEPYAAVRNFDGHLYQYVKIEGNKLSMIAVNAENKVIDSFEIKK